MPGAAMVAALTLFWAIPFSVKAEALTEDDVHLALKEHAVRDSIRSCLGPNSTLSAIEVTLEIGPDGKTKFVSVEPKMPEDSLLCVRYACEKLVFRPTGKHHEIKYLMKIKAAAEGNGQARDYKQTSEYKKLKRNSTGLLASGILLSAAGVAMTISGLILLYHTSIFEFPDPETEYERELRQRHVPGALFWSGVIAFWGGVALTAAGIFLYGNIRKYDKSAYMPTPGLYLASGSGKPNFSLAWTF